MPSISRYMTRQPWTIDKCARVAEARELMQRHHIRHLPVLEGGKLVGILSERDLRLIYGVHPEEWTVEDAMTDDVYAVPSEQPADTVVEEMADFKYGSVVILDREGKVIGIFTSVDAMQFFADVLRRATA